MFSAYNPEKFKKMRVVADTDLTKKPPLNGV
jgi:hypothetical protein